MAKITINGKVCEFEGSPSIIQVALANGIDIPRYCYHEGLTVVASCRVCLGEVWAPNPRHGGALEVIPRLLPTCQTPCGDGQVVRTDSPKAIANQKAVLEYLLINHPLDCPICDKSGECFLQDYSYNYGRGESRFEENKIKQPKKDIGPTIYLYSDRCIMCSRCVRFTREVTGTGELCIVGRGATEEIDLFPGKALDNELSGNVADICPVGALLDKDFLFSQRVWYLIRTPSIDGITASGDNISIEHNDGQIYRITPRRNLEVNKWWISDEIRYGWKFVHREDRLAEPVRQQYSERITSTFPQAYSDVLELLRHAQREGTKIAALISPMISCEEAYLLARFVRQWNPSPEEALLGVGPVPMSGTDKVFPPGAEESDANAYKIYAEKAPNARGVRRVLAAVHGENNVLEFDAFLKAIKTAAGVVILTGNYPSEWTTKELTAALMKKRIVIMDTLPNSVTPKADIVLPTATWAEKAGTFENANHRLQAFEQAIEPVDGARSEGQILTDLMHLTQSGNNGGTSPWFNAARVRAEMAARYDGLEMFGSEVHMPTAPPQVESDMELVAL